MLRIFRLVLIDAALLASVAFGLSGCVVFPYDDGYGHHHFHGDRHFHDDRWGHGGRW